MNFQPLSLSLRQCRHCYLVCRVCVVCATCQGGPSADSVQPPRGEKHSGDLGEGCREGEPAKHVGTCSILFNHSLFFFLLLHCYRCALQNLTKTTDAHICCISSSSSSFFCCSSSSSSSSICFLLFPLIFDRLRFCLTLPNATGI